MYTGILLLCGSSNGACVSARAAAYTFISVDNVLAVTLGDATGGACISASAACDAIVGNLVCHVKEPPEVVFPILL